jgi:hypothetical protein
MSHSTVPTALQRRRFLTATTSLAATATVPGIARSVGIEKTELMASDFRRALHTEFRAVALSQTNSQPSALVLADVSAASHPHPSLDRSTAHEFAFSLKFGVNTEGLLQDTYLLSHPTLGDFAALLVPTRSGDFLRAEFHRL